MDPTPSPQSSIIAPVIGRVGSFECAMSKYSFPIVADIVVFANRHSGSLQRDQAKMDGWLRSRRIMLRKSAWFSASNAAPFVLSTGRIQAAGCTPKWRFSSST